MLVVVDLQSECFEEGPSQFFGKLIDLDPGHGQRVDEIGVGRGLDARFGGVELGVEVVAAGAEFGAALVDVAQQVEVGVVDEFEVADRALDPLIGLRDRPLQGGDVLVVVAAGVGVEGGRGVVEQGAAVGARDVVGQEVVEAVDEQVFAENAPPGGCPSGV